VGHFHKEFLVHQDTLVRRLLETLGGQVPLSYHLLQRILDQ
jgi:hypothetical protein